MNILLYFSNFLSQVHICIMYVLIRVYVYVCVSAILYIKLLIVIIIGE